MTKNKALEIIETLTAAMKAGTQREALEAIAAWIQGNFQEDVTRMTPEERRARIVELLTHERDMMTAEERRERASFYLEGVENA